MRIKRNIITQARRAAYVHSAFHLAGGYKLAKRAGRTMLLILFFVLPGVCGWSQSPAKPNVLFILADDLGWADLGYQGSSFYETPHIDRLAHEGVVFSNGYAAAPVCSPSRAAILTGKYPARLDLTDYLPGNSASGPHKDQRLASQPFLQYLPQEEITMAEAFNKQGYATFFGGKWHLGKSQEYFPESQGFDKNRGGNGTGHPAKGYFSPYHNPQLPDGPEGEYLTDRITDETIRFIRENKDRPFLAYVSFYTVHLPLQAKAEKIKKYEAKRDGLLNQGDEFVLNGKIWTKQFQDHPVYAAMIESMDENIGRLLTTLEETGLAERTIVVFTSDNGGMATSNRTDNIPTTNFPLRAGKGWLYEGGIREPLIIRYPLLHTAGTVIPDPVIHTDLYPTLLDLAGLPLMPEQHRDGRSLKLLLQGGSFKSGALFWYFPHYSGGLGGRPAAAIREGRYKLIRFFEDDRIELYDIEQDNGEQHDQSATLPSVRRVLEKKLDKWMRKTKVKLPYPNPYYEQP